MAPGELGAGVDALQLVLGAGGGAATAASVLIAWLSNRAGEVTVKLTRGEETLEVTAKGVKNLNPAELRKPSTHIAEQLRASPPPPPAGGTESLAIDDHG